MPNARELIPDAADNVSLAEMHIHNSAPARSDGDRRTLHLAQVLLGKAVRVYELLNSRARDKRKYDDKLLQIEGLQERADRNMRMYDEQGAYVPFAMA
ncbi:hypothetical protein CMO91_04765 [Candidatus Woesearchaeota archaeon]|nr:hypothetical protein [Candidatus Woesearchaeota archaeon]|tara:strand:- start:776 stop:1069 length:294 start_codon:yes stop_codon:yes gene_type:complete